MMQRDDDDSVQLRVKIKERSGDYVLVSDGEADAWVPLLMVYEIFALIKIPKWMAKDRGLKGLI